MARKQTTIRIPGPAKYRQDYRIPALWNCWGYAGALRRDGGEVIVNPADYLRDCLEWIRTNSTIAGDATVSLSQGTAAGRVRRPGQWISRQLMYGMMIRTSAAWDHDGDGRLEGRRYAELGTFLKSILLMPMLARMGVTVLYLLPVGTASRVFRKGELGCPYASKSFLKLDPDQHDPLSGLAAEGLDAEFSLFVECAHRLGMRVMLDVAPRTAGRDCDWILDHPEWFYWIDRRYAATFGLPKLPEIAYTRPIPRRLGELYRIPAIREHLAKFRFAPSVSDPARWKAFAARTRANPLVDVVKAVADEFGVMVPPGSSDVINDLQPAWSDVTYLRLYLDHHPEAAALLPNPAAQPPYVLFDTIKCNLFPGREPNRPLWDQLTGIIPHYQRFGIDGARVDMAHALPVDLEASILNRARATDPDFCFLAEDLGNANTARHRRTGYNIVIGSSWWMQPRGQQGKMHEFVAQLPSLKLPVLAAAETPDTPRAAARPGGRAFARQAVVVDMFLPAAVPMINSGMEVFERQPMNLGLDADQPPGRKALPRTDPQYGKLAFFDRYALHWTNPGGRGMVELIGRAAAIRNRFITAITRKEAYFAPRLAGGRKHVLACGYDLGRRGGRLLVLANLDMKRAHRAIVADLQRGLPTPEVLLELEFSAVVPRPGGLSTALPPGDVKLILLPG